MTARHATIPVARGAAGPSSASRSREPTPSAATTTSPSTWPPSASSADAVYSSWVAPVQVLPRRSVPGRRTWDAFAPVALYDYAIIEP